MSDFIQPYQTDSYSTNMYDTVMDTEFKTVSEQFTAAKDAINTNIIPRQFPERIINNQTSAVKFQQYPEFSRNNYKSTLTGENIRMDYAFHNNMLPYFGSHIRQPLQENAYRPVLETFSGLSKEFREKQEPTPLFETIPDVINSTGTPDAVAEVLQGYVPSKYRQNELPFEQVRVGPGINKGFTNEPTGGFQQADAREYIMPKSIDELRARTNPQISYHGRVVPGKSVNDKGETIGEVEHRHPDKFWINSPDRYFTTIGAYTKEMKRPCQILKDTNRKTSKAYGGIAGTTQAKNPTIRSLIKKSFKNEYKADSWRNAYHKDIWGNAIFGDYGKSGFEFLPNERNITEERTHVTNFTTVVKAMIAPLLDVFRTTRKENVEGNIRQTGNVAIMSGGNNVVWDPNDVARTTIKETNIHDNRSGNIQTTEGRSGAVWDPNDVARTTIKETNIHDNRTGNIQTTESKASYVLDKETMTLRTTIKETLEPEPYNLNMKTRERGVVKDSNDVARTTTKETLIEDATINNLKGPTKLYVYDPNDVARTTTKETTIEDSTIGIVSGVDKGMGYLTNPQFAKTTTKQTTLFDYSGNPEDTRNMGGTGYMTNIYEAPNTNKQFTSDYAYSGNADSKDKKPMSYYAGLNARVNEVKEGTLVGRYPTPQNTKLWNGMDTVNIDIKKMDGDYTNHRQPMVEKSYNSVHLDPACSVTTDRNEYDEDKIGVDRIDPDLLQAFNSNPYTQPLSSYAFN